MRTFSRVSASLFIGSAIVMTGLTGPASAAKVKVDDRADEVLSWAKKQKGKPYVYGADGPGSFDCSGFVQYVYKKAGKKIGRTSGAQLSGKSIAKGDKKPGDILIFVRGGSAYHSAIYAGDGKMWEAQRTGTTVGKHKIWSQGYVVRRPSGGLKASTEGKQKLTRSLTPIETNSFAP
jgi:cell wall-associated NlpC family hydrolase